MRQDNAFRASRAYSLVSARKKGLPPIGSTMGKSATRTRSRFFAASCMRLVRRVVYLESGIKPGARVAELSRFSSKTPGWSQSGHLKRLRYTIVSRVRNEQGSPESLKGRGHRRHNKVDSRKDIGQRLRPLVSVGDASGKHSLSRSPTTNRTRPGRKPHLHLACWRASRGIRLRTSSFSRTVMALQARSKQGAPHSSTAIPRGTRLRSNAELSSP